jgi:hypothetical protein
VLVLVLLCGCSGQQVMLSCLNLMLQKLRILLLMALLLLLLHYQHLRMWLLLLSSQLLLLLLLLLFLLANTQLLQDQVPPCHLQHPR